MPLCEHCSNDVGEVIVDLATLAEFFGKEYVLTKRLLICKSCKKMFNRMNNKRAKERMATLELQEAMNRSIHLDVKKEGIME